MIRAFIAGLCLGWVAAVAALVAVARWRVAGAEPTDDVEPWVREGLRG